MLRFNTIEEKYGVEQGEDWLAIMLSSKFHRYQRVSFLQGKIIQSGVILDMERGVHFGHPEWYYLVKYDHKSIPRWTLSKWLKKS
jgi:hypothetical protein